MGKKGKKSQRGIGEKDTEVRNVRISIWVTKSDALGLEELAKKLGKSKADLLIPLIRELFDTPQV
ncbi:hypothetical protein ACE1CI_03235 [Aerosakkonemataceae cyanobacterium BLCC-F50]|uniref:Ribbon-helix-helix protein CopG domain-containing protein n=1 Tax=Floridaenema flaviceps BLCC-F50 TaxID=3153642 RepID=A0ABV4XJQ4_9CYAN